MQDLTLRATEGLSKSRFDYLCVRCKCRARAYDNKKPQEHCERCILVYQRLQQVKNNPELAERIILNIVGGLYKDAHIGELGEGLIERFSSLTESQDLVLHGDVGVGKTYAMAALVRYFVQRGYKCIRVNFDDYLCDLRSLIGTDRSEHQFIQPLKAVDKLFIDDLGLRTRQETDYAFTTLYNILNKRQEWNLPTYITTNKNITGLEESFDTRISSRLKGAMVLNLTGEDRR